MVGQEQQIADSATCNLLNCGRTKTDFEGCTNCLDWNWTIFCWKEGSTEAILPVFNVCNPDAFVALLLVRQQSLGTLPSLWLSYTVEPVDS